MILVADGGSTTCEWKIIDSGVIQKNIIRTNGFNPALHSSNEIQQILTEANEQITYPDAPSSVYYYGAGCSNDENNLIVERSLSSVFPASHIVVGHDLLGAAYALCGHQPGIVAILGTGSSAGFWDGKTIHEGVSLGYILGDEGSGSYIGKKLLLAYLYRQMPVHVSEMLEGYANVRKQEILNRVYKHSFPNVYLASFVPFIADNINDPFLNQLVVDAFQAFIGIHITSIKDFGDYPVNLVGSVAYIFKEVLSEVLKETGCNAGNIIRQPIDYLTEYIRKNYS